MFIDLARRGLLIAYTEFFMFLYHQADYLQIKNLSNLWQTRMGKAMIPLNTHIAICLNIEIRR